MERLFKIFREAGKELFLVGGAVRDLALGIEMKDLDDLDFCTNALPAQSLEILKKNNFSTYDMGFEFGTVGATLYGPKEGGFPKDVQVTTYRSSEFYRRGSRHPEVKFGTTIEQDLKRRDFSINSMAFDEKGEFFDPYDGLGDLKKGVLRVVSDPQETLAEDPLRILRVARFVSRLGFSIDPALMDAACARSNNIKEISKERWLQEMNKLLVGDYVKDAIDFLVCSGVFHVILPELWEGTQTPANEKSKALTEAVEMLVRAEKNKALRWGILLHHILPRITEKERDKVVAKIGKRFTFDNESTREIRAIVRHQHLLLSLNKDVDDPALKRVYLQLAPFFHALCDFSKAKDPKRESDMVAFESRVEELQKEGRLIPELPSGVGEEMMKDFSLKPSRLIGEMKSFLENEIIDDRLQSRLSAPEYVDYLRHHYDWD